MSLKEETRTLGDERDRLDAELDEIVAQLADATDDETASAQMLQSEARDLDLAGQAVGALIDEYGEDATVTVRGLDALEFAEVQNKTADANASSSSTGGVPGTGSLAYAAAGLVDAPWLEAGEDGANPGLDAKIQAFEGLPPGARIWIQDLVDELGSVEEGNWRPLPERIADAASRE